MLREHDTPSAEAMAAGEFVGIDAAAKRLGVGKSTVHAMMNAGELPYMRPHGLEKRGRRISAVYLDYFIRKNLVAR